MDTVSNSGLNRQQTAIRVILAVLQHADDTLTVEILTSALLPVLRRLEQAATTEPVDPVEADVTPIYPGAWRPKTDPEAGSPGFP